MLLLSTNSKVVVYEVIDDDFRVLNLSAYCVIEGIPNFLKFYASWSVFIIAI